MELGGPNREQIAYWNEQAGPKWVALHARLDAQLGPLGELSLGRASLHPGESAIDVGCGCGDSTLELARRVGPTGSVLGVDISEVMLERARERVAEAGHSNVRFALADAQIHAFEPGAADVIHSRFGVMFFSDPTAAFTNLRRALCPTGRIVFLSWQPLANNPWMQVAVESVSKHVALPEPLAADAPGPFAFGESGRVRKILEGAGFREIAFEAVEKNLLLGGPGTLDDAVKFALEVGPAARALREAGESASAAIADSVREALAPYLTPEGVRLACAAWITTARAT